MGWRAWFGANLGETAPGADLGGSSIFSNESFEGRRGGVPAVGHGLVDPKRQGCSAYAGFCLVVFDLFLETPACKSFVIRGYDGERQIVGSLRSFPQDRWSRTVFHVKRMMRAIWDALSST